MPQPATCVFCGARIEPGEEMSGRPPHAAHARCADAALADDRHWDAVAAATGADQATGEGDQSADTPPTAATPGGGRAGCLGVVVLGFVGVVAYGLRAGSDLLHRLDILGIERERR
jgi:hypothetical protein